MRRLEHLGPALVTLAAAGTLLLAAPVLVRRASRERTAVEMAAAEERLQRGTLLEELSQSTRDIATLVEPSVVHVSTSSPSGRRARNFTNSGSGWVYDAGGHIVTNAHVVDASSRIEVQFRDGERRDAELVGLDLRTDIAVLHVDPVGLVPARRAAQDPSQGEMVFAFGSPFDFRFSMSSGIVSGIGRTAGLQDVTYENFIQTDAAVNPGNSGGPLTNTRGDVVGMTTAIATGRGNAVGQGQFAGIGLAIPISMIENVVDQLIERGEVQKGFLGVASVDMELVRRGMAQGEPLIRHAAQNFSGDGTVITLVSPGSPAERAGLQVGDVITQVDGRRVSGSSQLRALVAGRRPGESLPIDFWRPVLGREVPGQVQRVNVVIDRLEPEVASGGIAEGLRQLGFRELVTCTEDQALAHGVTFRRGVLVAQLDPASRVAREIPPGSVIVQAFGAPVNNLDDFYTRLEREMLRGQRMPQIPVTIVRPDGAMMPVVLSPRSTD